MIDFPLRLATRKNGSRDGELMLVNVTGKRWASAKCKATTMTKPTYLRVCAVSTGPMTSAVPASLLVALYRRELRKERT